MCTRQQKPITVKCNVWTRSKWFRHGGKTHHVSLISQAREYLAAHGRQLIVKF
jgi:hypothetical protein